MGAFSSRGTRRAVDRIVRCFAPLLVLVLLLAVAVSAAWRSSPSARVSFAIATAGGPGAANASIHEAHSDRSDDPVNAPAAPTSSEAEDEDEDEEGGNGDDDAAVADLPLPERPNDDASNAYRAHFRGHPSPHAEPTTPPPRA